METDVYSPLLEISDGAAGAGAAEASRGVGEDAGWYLPYSTGFQVSLTSFLVLEVVLGFSSNLTVLVLYCAQSNLVDSVSNMVTVNLHVLDVIVCVLCVPFTMAVVLVPVDGNLSLLCCFHEACVTFTSIATAVNVLVISVDRYDISVRPAARLLTPRRAALLLAVVWAVSLAVFFLPFLEVEVFSSAGPERESVGNRTLLCVGGQSYHMELAVYYHLLLQVPVFFSAVLVMLFTYFKILQALNIRIGSQLKRSHRLRGMPFRKRNGEGPDSSGSSGQIKYLSHPPLIPSPTPTPTSPPPLSSGPAVTPEGGATPIAPTTPAPGTMGVQASVSAIIALRRAVRRHRDRRERQRRVFKMSLVIISSFLGCWAPISVVNVLILSLGPSDGLVRLRLCFLVVAYGTTILHPLLYAFTRQKLRRAFRARVKRRVVSMLQADTVSGTGGRRATRNGRKTRQDGSDATERCLTEVVRD